MPKQVRLRLTEPQERFAFSEAVHPGMVAGYGAGKSEAAVIRTIVQATRYPGLPFGFVEPTYDLMTLIAWPRFDEILTKHGISYDLNKSEKIMTIENGSQIIFRSGDTPGRMVGFEVADAVIDEADTLKPKDAEEVWKKMWARCRFPKPDGSPNTLGAVSTPEGFGWMYNQFGREVRPGHELIRAPTYSNPYLPASYVQQLRDTYSGAELDAYLEGRFVNLKTGTVYGEFDRTRHASAETIKPGEPLHVGMDFNVGKMAAVVCVLRSGKPHAVAELTDIFDTPAMCKALKARFDSHQIIVYPDASGGSRKTANASISDLTQIRQAGLQVRAPTKNGPVKDRIAAVNSKFRKMEFFVNIDACPTLADALEQQCYDKNGAPDKSTGLDHILDGLGYYVVYRWPIRKPITSAVITFN